MKHVPILLNEVLQMTEEIPKVEWILDGTFGRGGHARALLEKHPNAKLIGLDRDPEAISYGQKEFEHFIQEERLQLVRGNFHELTEIFKHPEVKAPIAGFDVILLDLGVSSPQLDEGHRGFSFYHEGPLDMRMDPEQKLSAADVVNTWSEVELNGIFSEYGEIRRPHRVVQKIIQARKEKQFTTAQQLAQLIEHTEGWRKKGHHPATQYFLALRIVVNDELNGLQNSLPDLMRALRDQGRLIVLTFHSLEDRIVKYDLRGAGDIGFPVNKKVIVPERAEILSNPRSRSCKMRVFQRGEKHEKAALRRT